MLDCVIQSLIAADRKRQLPIASRTADNAEIDSFEVDTGIKFPPEFRNFLLHLNGCLVSTSCFFGIGPGTSSYDLTQWERREWIKKGWVVCGYDGCGNPYLLVTNRDYGLAEPIIFIDMYQQNLLEPCYLFASDIWHAIAGLLEEEKSPNLDTSSFPFDFDLVKKIDPAMLDATNVRFPWEVR